MAMKRQYLFKLQFDAYHYCMSLITQEAAITLPWLHVKGQN